MKNFILAIVGLLIGFVSTLTQAFVFTKIWSWFIVEHFQVEALTLAAAIGISTLSSLILASHFIMQSDLTGKEKKISDAIGKGIAVIVMQFISLLTAYFYYCIV
jgi:hypothetical protein